MNIKGKFGITVLGSDSKGNASVIHGPEGLILLDAGFSARELETRMAACGIRPADIRALIVTHEHSDHMKGCRVFSNKYGIRTYMTSLTCGGGLSANFLPERKSLLCGNNPMT